MKYSTILMTISSAILFLSCDKDKNELDSVTVNYQIKQTLCFAGGLIDQYKDSTVLVAKRYFEQTLLSTEIHSDTTFLSFEIKNWEFSVEDSLFKIDTILVSKTKYYQLQTNSYIGLFPFLKTNDVNSDTTKKPLTTSLQYPLHPVFLKEGETLRLYRPETSLFNQVERVFQIKEKRTIGNYNGIYVLGTHYYDKKYSMNFRQLFNSDGKLISESDYGENVHTDPVGNVLYTYHSFDILNRVTKQEMPYRYMSKLKIGDLSRLF